MDTLFGELMYFPVVCNGIFHRLLKFIRHLSCVPTEHRHYGHTDTPLSPI